ncbi:MAG: hypothetical protein ACLFSB_10405 [Chitinispirillaceae bacterium]
MRRVFVFGSLAMAAFMMMGCDNDSNPATPPAITTNTYIGKIIDSSMTTMSTYNGTLVKYELSSNDSFTVSTNIGYGYGIGETGTYTHSGRTYNFTPLMNQTFAAGGTIVPISTPRAAYTGTLASDTLSFAGFIKISESDHRDCGTLKCAKQ